MARPARVRMRSLKPCVLARRRLFGWKVRLLTGSPGAASLSSTRSQSTDHITTQPAPTGPLISLVSRRHPLLPTTADTGVHPLNGDHPPDRPVCIRPQFNCTGVAGSLHGTRRPSGRSNPGLGDTAGRPVVNLRESCLLQCRSAQFPERGANASPRLWTVRPGSCGLSRTACTRCGKSC
jgi:hypothetical protein